MRLIALTAFLVLSCSTIVLSQADFRPGYVVTNQNDTLKGLIDYKGSKANALECRFKADKNSEVRVYRPTEIGSYRFDGSKYFVAKIPYPEVGEVLFLEYLINGTVDIYFFRDAEGDHYLVDKGDGILRKLHGGDQHVLVDGASYVRDDKRYVGVLKAVFAESPTIAKRAEESKLNHHSLIKIAKDYHEEVCTTESCIVYEKKLPEKIKSWGISAVVNYYKFIVPGDNYPDAIEHLDDMEFDAVVYPSLGAFYRTNLPNLNEKLFFLTDAQIHIRKFDGSSISRNGSGSFIITDKTSLTFKQVSLSCAFTFGYEAPKGRIKPTFQAGGFFEKMLSNDLREVYTRSYSWGSQDYQSVNTYNKFSNSDFGVVLGAGLLGSRATGKAWMVDARYNWGMGINYVGYVMNTSNISLGIRYGL
jgi:hypothetical protein